jgi:hypothetical protein
MSMLQAARAEALGLDHDSALSWGLNRAIFFAAAKRGFKGGAASARREKTKKTREEGEKPTYYLGDEMAYVDEKNGKLYFTIGGDTQTPEDFKRQIQSRFQTDSNFKKAWKEAMEIIKQYDRETLNSGNKFFDQVYKPRRDPLSEKWNQMVSES